MFRPVRLGALALRPGRRLHRPHRSRSRRRSHRRPAAMSTPPRASDLARQLALALADPGFRAQVKQDLDRSPVREGKLHLQRYLSSRHARATDDIARISGRARSAVERDIRRAPQLELYLPVPAHRAAWKGDARLLVATAGDERVPPVAFTTSGERIVLSRTVPPDIPVLALVPVETDFDAVERAGLQGGNTGGGSTPPPGLYMTNSHLVETFESWVKGKPEVEVHILGQAGSSDSMTTYSCAAGSASGYFNFDQNSLDWSGSVLLINQTQLNNYKTAHPNQNLRVFFVEDDDTPCQIKVDPARFTTLVKTVEAAYPLLTGGRDSTSSTLGKIWKRANAIQRLIKALASILKTNDELIGNAVESTVVGRVVRQRQLGGEGRRQQDQRLGQAGDEIGAPSVDAGLIGVEPSCSTAHREPSMRLHRVILIALLAAPPPSAAQAPADPSGWRLGGGVDALRFGEVALSDAVPGAAAEVRPSARAGAYLSAMRSAGHWRFGLEAGWAGGHLEAGNDVIALQDRTAAVSRYRLAAGLGRRVAPVGGGVVEATLAPTLDLWKVAARNPSSGGGGGQARASGAAGPRGAGEPDRVGSFGESDRGGRSGGRVGSAGTADAAGGYRRLGQALIRRPLGCHTPRRTCCRWTAPCRTARRWLARPASRRRTSRTPRPPPDAARRTDRRERRAVAEAERSARTRCAIKASASSRIPRPSSCRSASSASAVYLPLR